MAYFTDSEGGIFNYDPESPPASVLGQQLAQYGGDIPAPKQAGGIYWDREEGETLFAKTLEQIPEPVRIYAQQLPSGEWAFPRSAAVQFGKNRRSGLNDFWHDYGVAVTSLGMGGIAGLAGGAGTAGAGAAEGGAALAGAELSAPVGSALATGAQEAAIADLVASGMSSEAATAAVMSGGETLSGVGTGLGTGGAAGAAGSTALSRLLGLSQQDSDILSVLGTVGATGLGMYSAGREADTLKGLAAQTRAERAPFLAAGTEYLSPEAWIAGPGQAFTKGTLQQLSATHGNPIGSPTALGIATDAGMRNWLSGVNTLGSLGLGGQGIQANLGAQAAQSRGDIYTTLGGGISDLINPRRSLADLLKDYRNAGLV